MIDFFSGYFITISAILLTCIIGLVIRLFAIGKVSLLFCTSNILLDLFIGLISIVTFYSIFKTNCRTVNWIFILFGCLYFILRHREDFETNEIAKPSKFYIIIQSLVLLLIVTILYTIYYYSAVSIKFHTFRPVVIDDYFYANLSTFLDRGYENLSFSKNFLQDCSIASYHYFEIWVNSFLYSLYQINALFSFSVILPVIVQFSIYLCLVSIGELLYGKSWLLYTVCFIFLFTTDINIILSHISPHAFLYPNAVSSSLLLFKEAPISLFVLMFLFFLFQTEGCSAIKCTKNCNAGICSFLILLSLAIVSTTVIPVLFSTLGVYLLFVFFKTRSYKDYRLYLFLSYFLFFVFYILLTSKGATDFSNKIDYEFDYSLLRLYITIPLGLIAAYSPLILVLCLFMGRDIVYFIKKYFIVIIAFFVFPISMNVFFRQYHGDAVQFTFIPYTAIINILIPVLLLYVYKYVEKIKSRNVYFAYSLIVLTFILNISSVLLYKFRTYQPLVHGEITYQEKIVDCINFYHDKNDIYVGIYMNEYDFSNWRHSNNSDSNGLVTFLQAYFNNCCYYSINKGVRGFSDVTPYMALHDSLFTSGSISSEDEFRDYFINLTKIKYIFVYPNVKISENLKSKLRFISRNPVDGISFYRVINCNIV